MAFPLLYREAPSEDTGISLYFQYKGKKAADGEGTKFVTFAVRCKYSIIAPQADSRCCGTN